MILIVVFFILIMNFKNNLHPILLSILIKEDIIFIIMMIKYLFLVIILSRNLKMIKVSLQQKQVQMINLKMMVLDSQGQILHYIQLIIKIAKKEIAHYQLLEVIQQKIMDKLLQEMMRKYSELEKEILIQNLRLKSYLIIQQ
ncbi:hypothetical protein IMG5_191940 [Ichthyophthirius multifiliis]|uniref:Transmembrane protein n=1 Tax=Ichthyophthirius multifiliis TaxID=5932 RepID=G0R4F2_ICHMU|nr:hypothetical protein IMG5_191940 [Ichthyophthirius multifiliis]EGR27653.1 hypothetical protein IMG5_191940 [Ichthyophthirius multifiliis]|eukprot:XP_004025105.1 hypothetical protein IMG5_191940 [Ichthyophthirius multifiliis]